MSSDAMDTVRMPAWSSRPVAGAKVLPDRQAPVRTNEAATTEPPVTAAALKGAAQAIESYMKSTNRNLEFRLDEASGQMVVSVRDAATGDLIRQIPGEAALRLARHLNEENVSLINLTV